VHHYKHINYNAYTRSVREYRRRSPDMESSCGYGGQPTRSGRPIISLGVGIITLP